MKRGPSKVPERYPSVLQRAVSLFSSRAFNLSRWITYATVSIILSVSCSWCIGSLTFFVSFCTLKILLFLFAEPPTLELSGTLINNPYIKLTEPYYLSSMPMNLENNDLLELYGCFKETLPSNTCVSRFKNLSEDFKGLPGVASHGLITASYGDPNVNRHAWFTLDQTWLRALGHNDYEVKMRYTTCSQTDNGIQVAVTVFDINGNSLETYMHHYPQVRPTGRRAVVCDTTYVAVNMFGLFVPIRHVIDWFFEQGYCRAWETATMTFSQMSQQDLTYKKSFYKRFISIWGRHQLRTYRLLPHMSGYSGKFVYMRIEVPKNVHQVTLITQNRLPGIHGLMQTFPSLLPAVVSAFLAFLTSLFAFWTVFSFVADGLLGSRARIKVE